MKLTKLNTANIIILITVLLLEIASMIVMKEVFHLQYEFTVIIITLFTTGLMFLYQKVMHVLFRFLIIIFFLYMVTKISNSANSFLNNRAWLPLSVLIIVYLFHYREITKAAIYNVPRGLFSKNELRSIRNILIIAAIIILAALPFIAKDRILDLALGLLPVLITIGITFFKRDDFQLRYLITLLCTLLISLFWNFSDPAATILLLCQIYLFDGFKSMLNYNMLDFETRNFSGEK